MIEQHTNTPKAQIFDIQHFSLNDGPGIRSSIFFKGCPLRCQWCHNPESFEKRKQLYYNKTLCTKCFKCVDVCPTGALTKKEINGKLFLDVDFNLCNSCGNCEQVCCYDAISLIGKEVTINDLLEQIKKGMPYYKTMKGQEGGITLTGGEPMMQFDFIEKLLDHIDGIHICMETSGYGKPEQFEKIVSKVDLFLFDYKATPNSSYKKLCGVENTLILANLELLYNLGANIILRLPMIPGVNDSDQHLEAIAALIRKYPNLKKTELLAYNNFGNSKAENLGKEQEINNLPSADKQTKERWINRFKELGVVVEIG